LSALPELVANIVELKKNIIGADHEFHDKEFALGWAERFIPTPVRLKLFDIILSELQAVIPEQGHVVELGIGPGYLANYLLKAIPGIKYCGVDFSEPMLDIARSRLDSYSSRVKYIQADLVNDHWETMPDRPIDAVVSTWALHDLGSQMNVKKVYEKSANALGEHGILLNGDFIKPDGTTLEFEPGRFQISRHLEMLRNIGFRNSECLILLEEEIETPTSAQNYACFKALR
jgi:SAM-dependent methyltransferase